jgi:hypothetical protein
LSPHRGAFSEAYRGRLSVGVMSIGCCERAGEELDMNNSDASIKQAVRRVAQALKAAGKNPEVCLDGDPDIEDCCQEVGPKKPLVPMVRIVTPSGAALYIAPDEAQPPNKPKV